MEINKIMVIGAGQMGAGIAEVCATAGYEVLLCDTSEQSLQAGIARITKNLEKNVLKERITIEEKDAILARFSLETTMERARKLI